MKKLGNIVLNLPLTLLSLFGKIILSIDETGELRFLMAVATGAVLIVAGYVICIEQKINLAIVLVIILLSVIIYMITNKRIKKKRA